MMRIRLAGSFSVLGGRPSLDISGYTTLYIWHEFYLYLVTNNVVIMGHSRLIILASLGRHPGVLWHHTGGRNTKSNGVRRCHLWPVVDRSYRMLNMG